MIKIYVPAQDGLTYTESLTISPIKIQYNSQPFFFDINGDRK